MYEKTREYMRTGDIIAFSGKGRTSNIIKRFTHSDISHVGIVYCTEGRIKIMESTSLNGMADCETGEFIKGVQVQYLSERLESYDGQAYWCALNQDANEYPMLEWLQDVHGKRTPYDTIQALGAGADWIDYLGFANEEDFSSLFCSELVCKALQLAGVVNREVNPSEQTPADVMKYKCLEARLQIG